ncbi:MAG: hypothetical protein N2423_10725, partial [Novosphingobium sp.]|nr:hypothetical protein [Novosphingobium sp.]
MDEELVRRWNAVVRDQDLVYHLGDVSMGRQGLHVLSRLRGRKILIRGNHDTASDEEYLAHFEKILACLSLKGMLLTHIPIHP